MRIGVISDTHGLLRPEAVVALGGVSRILHAGDVGDATVLQQLGDLAPVTAIRGNIDRSGPCAKLPETTRLKIEGRSLCMLHNLKDLDVDPVAERIAVVISGHSHKAMERWSDGVLYFNPGSAGPRRFSLPISLGILEITISAIAARIVKIG